RLQETSSGRRSVRRQSRLGPLEDWLLYNQAHQPHSPEFVMKVKPQENILLLLNGELGSAAQARKLGRQASLVLCADGGARHAAKLGLVPRAVIGDMDSLPDSLPRWKSTIYVCDFDSDVSDFEKSLRFIARRKFIRAAKRTLGI